MVWSWKQKCLEVLSEDREWWCSCDVSRQIVPYCSARSCECATADCRSTDDRYVQPIRAGRTQSSSWRHVCALRAISAVAELLLFLPCAQAKQSIVLGPPVCVWLCVCPCNKWKSTDQKVIQLCKNMYYGIFKIWLDLSDIWALLLILRAVLISAKNLATTQKLDFARVNSASCVVLKSM